MKSGGNPQVLKNILLTAMGSVLVLSAAKPALAAQGNEFDYPELMVTPRASERLETEAANESGRRWTSMLPIQISGLTTLVAGAAQLASPDPSKDASGVTGLAGLAVGGGWLVTSLALEAWYQPYTSASKDISALPRKTQREQLVRERYAEEAINAQARLACRLKWISVATNLGANIYMATQAKPSSFSQVADGVAAAVALTPLIFRSHAQDVADEQSEYKKRIYAPLATATVFSEPRTGQVAPGLLFSMSF
jgi:hypothetical protein